MAGKKQFPLRLDPSIYEAIEKWANDEFRSVNAHIEYLLRESLRREGRLKEKRGRPDQREREDP
ncbi:MAG: Arc family DNA-binding protein [Thermicanus sp.]|nr:Arc family DNA-binding protein [Thermicanus sp.]